MSDVGFEVDGSLTDQVSGTFLLSDIVATADACRNGDWLSASMFAAAGALDGLATASDPFGSLLSAGLGWLMDHFEPLKGWLNDLTGDAAAVGAFAATWATVSTGLSGDSGRLERISLDDFTAMNGRGVSSYQTFAKGLSEDIKGLSTSAGAVSEGINQAASIIAVVHGLVRDVIAQVVGSAISWAAEVVFTLGAATPWVIEQVSTRVASLAARVGTHVKALVESVTALKALLTKLDGLLGGLTRHIHGKAPKRPAPRHRSDAPPKKPEPWSLSDPHPPRHADPHAPQHRRGPSWDDMVNSGTEKVHRVPGDAATDAATESATGAGENARSDG